MAITFGVATTTGVNAANGLSGNGDLTVTLPTSWEAGQVCVVVIYMDGASAAASTPSGWAAVSGSPFGGSSNRLAIFTRTLQGGDSNPTFTISNSGGDGVNCGAAMTFNGVSGTPVEAVGTASEGTGSPMTAGATTTVSNGAWALGVCGRGDNEAASNQSFGGSTTGVTERLDAGTNVGSDAEVSAYSKEITTGGSTTGAGSADTNITDPWVSVIIVLKPAPPPLTQTPDDDATVSDVVTTPVLKTVHIHPATLFDGIAASEYCPTPDYGEVAPLEPPTLVENLTLAEALTRGITTYGPMRLREAVTAVLSPLAAHPFDSATIAEYRGAVVTPLAPHLVDQLTLSEAKAVVTSPLAPHPTDNATVADWVKAVVNPLVVHAAESLTAGEFRKGVDSPLAPHVDDDAAFAEWLKGVLEPLATHLIEELFIREDVQREISGTTPPIERTPFDSATLTESLVAALTPIVVSVYDSLSASEFAKRVLTPLAVHVDDDAAVSENVKRVLTPLAAHPADSATIAGYTKGVRTPLAVHVDDDATVAEYAKGVVTPRAAHPADSATISEYVKRVLTPVVASLVESLSASDYAEREIVAAGPMSAGPYDSAALSEYLKGVITPLAVHAAENLVASEFADPDVIWVGEDLAKSVFDSLTVTEAASSAIKPLRASVVDVATVVDAVTAVLSKLRSLVFDSLAASDYVSAAVQGMSEEDPAQLWGDPGTAEMAAITCAASTASATTTCEAPESGTVVSCATIEVGGAR